MRVLGPVNLQLDSYPAASLLHATHKKLVDRINDATLVRAN